MIINIAKEEDLPDILRLEKENFSDPWNQSMIYNDWNNRSIYIIGRNENGEPIGYASMLLLITEGEILRICVRKQYRAKGCGSALIAKILELGKEKSFEKIFLEVSSQNEHAIKLYEHFGFYRISIRKDYYGTDDSALIYCYAY